MDAIIEGLLYVQGDIGLTIKDITIAELDKLLLLGFSNNFV